MSNPPQIKDFYICEKFSLTAHEKLKSLNKKVSLLSIKPDLILLESIYFNNSGKFFIADKYLGIETLLTYP